jgi:hypothetical protein
MCCFLIHNVIRVNQSYEDEYDLVDDGEVHERFDHVDEN